MARSDALNGTTVSPVVGREHNEQNGLFVLYSEYRH